MAPFMDVVEHLRISFEEIKLATRNFESKIAHGGFGNVYKGKLVVFGQQTAVAVKRLNPQHGQGLKEFNTEIQILSFYRHKNLVSLLKFCDDDGEMILVYEYVEHGSLDKHLSDSDLSWMQRLHISLDVARGINYLHNDVGPQHRVLHRDIKSSNILLTENWEGRIADFGLSIIGPSNGDVSFVVDTAVGTGGYVDPQYIRTGIVTKESDVYSFGVVLFEILCGRLAFINTLPEERKDLAKWAKSHFEQNTLHEIIFPSLTTQINEVALKLFSTVAYQCLREKQSERPTMGWIIKELERVLDLPKIRKVAGSIQVGTQSGVGEWSFECKEGHNLVKITIEHGAHVIYSLMFTTESEGVLHVWGKFGGYAGGVSNEILLESKEQLIRINGTNVTRDGNPKISSLSFQTNKKIYGPFGTETETLFSLPWEKGSLVGFYGFGVHSIDGIGVYVKPSDQRQIKVGPWGKTPNYWYVKLYSDEHKLRNITIGHGDFIYSIMFNKKKRGFPKHHPSSSSDGVRKIEVITFDDNEVVIALHGRVALTVGNDPAISSLSFETNKQIHGPFGDPERGIPFTIPCEPGSLAGLHGVAGYYIESIGMYLNVVA